MKEIKKFEAYTYRGKGLKSNRKEILDEIIDIFPDSKILDYEISGTMFETKNEILYLFLWKENNNEEKILKLDLSDMGIEIGTMKYNEDEDEYEDFIPQIDLTSNTTKQIKNYKSDIQKFNV